MGMYYILYNPFAGNGACKKEAECLNVAYDNSTLINMTRITNYRVLLGGLEPEDAVVICGGDGTLNRFINDTNGIAIRNNIYYYAVGSGNDFIRDLNKEKGSQPDFPINSYLTKLPTVTVNGKMQFFLNGVGYGIDGYCCEKGDILRESTDKPVNYTTIAIKGLLFHYKPTRATITVDGAVHTFHNVWLAPTMHGKYYGGGMMCAPDQDRTAESKQLSVVILHNTGKLRTLCIFPSIFKGTHVKYKKQVEVLTGHDIIVEFDRPTPLQIDGETILNVTKYHAQFPSSL